MSRLAGFRKWFQERVFEYSKRNPLTASVAFIGTLGVVGSVYAAEQQFEKTTMCKKIWVAGNLLQRTTFKTEPVHLENPCMYNAVHECLNRDMNRPQEKITVIAGSMGIGKTTEAKSQLNGRRGVVYVDLHELSDDLDDQQHMSAVKDLILRAISFRKYPKGDLQEACAVIADVSRVFVWMGLDPVFIILDGANKAVVMEPGKKPKSAILELFCVKVSPCAPILLLSSGFSALSLDQVSHVGARVQITLGEPVHNDTALLKWAYSTYPKWTEQQRHSAVQALDGNFGDYGKVSDMQANKKLPFSDALCQLQQNVYINLRDKSLGFRKAPTPRTSKDELDATLERYRVIQELTSSPSKRISGREPAVNYLVEKKMLCPRFDGIVADSRIKEQAMERLVKSPFVSTRVEQIKLLLAGPTPRKGGLFQSADDGTSNWNQKLEDLEAKARREFAGTEKNENNTASFNSQRSTLLLQFCTADWS